MNKDLLKNYVENKPIFLSDIIDKTGLSRARVNQYVKKYIDSGLLSRYADGIFFIPTKTVIGNSTLDIRDVIEKKIYKK